MFKKSSYSDLEVQEILATLFEEKKKVKEWELKAKQNTLSPAVLNVREELEETKQQLATLKNNHQLALERLTKAESASTNIEAAFNRSKSEKEQYDLKMNELKEKLGSKEREHQHSLEILKISEEELTAVKQQILNLRLELQKAKDPTDRQNKEAQLETVIHFMRQKADESQKEQQDLIHRLQTYEEAVRSLQFQIKTIDEEKKLLAESLRLEKEAKSDILLEEGALKTQFEALKQSHNKLQDNLRQTILEKNGALSDSQTQKEAFINSQREIELLKQMMMKTLQEFKEERLKEEQSYESQILQLKAHLEQHQQQLQQKDLHGVELQKLNLHLQERLDHNENKMKEKTSELESLISNHQELIQFAEELKDKLGKSEESKRQAVELSQQKQTEFEKLHAQLTTLTHSLADAEESLQQVEGEAREHESRLRVAQQHLAKKVRETNALTEKFEESQLIVTELEQALETAKIKLAESQGAFEAELQNQKKLQQQALDNVKTIELQSAKWEEKYFQLHERWQEAEARNKELKKLEERFGKLQQVLGNLTHLISSPAALPIMETVSLESNKVREFADVEPAANTNAPFAAIQQTIFDASKSAPRFKETFF